MAGYTFYYTRLVIQLSGYINRICENDITISVNCLLAVTLLKRVISC